MQEENCILLALPQFLSGKNSVRTSYIQRDHNHGSDIKQAKIESIIKENLCCCAPFSEVPVGNVFSNICRSAEKLGLGCEYLPSTSALRMRIHQARDAFTEDPPIPKVFLYISMHIAYGWDPNPLPLSPRLL